MTIPKLEKFILENRNHLSKTTVLQLENKLTVAGERMGKRDSYGVWDGHVHSAIFKMGNQQGPTV